MFKLFCFRYQSRVVGLFLFLRTHHGFSPCMAARVAGLLLPERLLELEIKICGDIHGQHHDLRLFKKEFDALNALIVQKVTWVGDLSVEFQ